MLKNSALATDQIDRGENGDHISLPNVSLVVIGYNEASNLPATFMAIQAMDYPKDKVELIYVDSGSQDNSVEIARSFGARVFVEKVFPSPGRNRNRGLIEASHGIVHFLDGDVTIDPKYLINVVHLFAAKDVIAVVGRLDERDSSVLNTLASWSNSKKKEGYALLTSTGGTYLRKELLDLNGYDERIRRGQESELGVRIRESGKKIWCTNQRLGVHNFGIRNLRSYLRRDYLNGISLVQRARLKGDTSYFQHSRRVLKKQQLQMTLLMLALIVEIIDIRAWLVFTLLLPWIVYENRRFLCNQYPIHLKILKLILAIPSKLCWFGGIIKELIGYHLSRQDRGFYSLQKDNLSTKMRN